MIMIQHMKNMKSKFGIDSGFIISYKQRCVVSADVPER